MELSQVLALHRVSEHKFELSGLRTGSVRDQMLRAQLLVEALCDAKPPLISATQRLIVAGGGVAGAVAALTAAARGVRVDVIERSDNLFTTQLGVNTRWLDPTEFDWPHHHWEKGDIHWGGRAGPPLDYKAGRASDVAAIWSGVMNDLEANGPPASWRGGSVTVQKDDAAAFSFFERPNGVVVAKIPSLLGTLLGAAISCIGFSGERTTVGTFVGPLFWKNDDLDTLPKRLDPGASSEPLSVLISGGGDGAQQDFLRALTGMFGKRLFHALDVGTALKSLSKHLADILMAEDAGRRAHAWSTGRVVPKQDYLLWHTAYEDLAAEILNFWIKQGRIATLLSVLDRNVAATWLVGSEVPTFCYGLNRLLALLVGRLHQAQPPRRPPVIVTGFMLKSLQSVDGHACNASCYKRQHTALVHSVDDPTATDTLGPFDLVVVRHGVAQSPLFSAGAPIREQLVPMQPPG